MRNLRYIILVATPVVCLKHLHFLKNNKWTHLTFYMLILKDFSERCKFRISNLLWRRVEGKKFLRRSLFYLKIRCVYISVEWILSLHVTQGNPIPRNTDLSSPYESDMSSYFLSYSSVDVKFTQTWIVFLQLPVDVKKFQMTRKLFTYLHTFLKGLKTSIIFLHPVILATRVLITWKVISTYWMKGVWKEKKNKRS